jgi:hypothetical protein
VSGTRQGVEPFVADPELEYVPGRGGSTSCCHDVPSPLRCAGIATDCCHGGEPAVFAASTGAGGTRCHGGVLTVSAPSTGDAWTPSGGVPAGACHGGAGVVNCCQAGRGSGAAWPGAPPSNCCQPGGDPFVVKVCGVVEYVCAGSEPAGWSVGHAVLEMASGRWVAGSTAGRKPSALPPVCHASVVERHPWSPEADRHSVVCRHRAVCSAAIHSAASVRHPTPSTGYACRSAGCSPSFDDGCAHASACWAQASASALG